MVISILRILLEVFSIIVIVDVIFSYFMSPFHPIRTALDRIVEPVLGQIRKVIPPINMIDISPIVLILLIQVIDLILAQFS